jgi:hypothetical protein
MLRELNWLSIHQHIIYKSVMFIWDTLHGDNEELQKNLKLNSDVHSYHTRGEKNCHVPTQNNRSGQKSIFVNGLKLNNCFCKRILKVHLHAGFLSQLHGLICQKIRGFFGLLSQKAGLKSLRVNAP